MASGKSTIGGQLADSLGMDFYDTDSEISKWKGQTIQEIFASDGEAKFRSYEMGMIRFLSSLDKVIISTGGGLAIYNENMKLMLETGIVIFIDVEVSTIARRVVDDGNIRPLHNQNKDTVNLEKDIKQRLGDRLTIYTQAHLTISGENSPTEITSEILSKIRGDY